MNKICPFWDYLDEIFSPKTSLNPVALYESGQQNLKDDLNEGELIVDDNVQFDFALDENDSMFNSNDDVPQSLTSPDASRNTCDENDDLSMMTKRLQIKPRANQNHSSALLLEISKMRNEQAERKLDLEAKKLALDEKRCDRDYEIKKMECEARKLEAENTRMQLELQLQLVNQANQRQNYNVN